MCVILCADFSLSAPRQQSSYFNINDLELSIEPEHPDWSREEIQLLYTKHKESENFKSAPVKHGMLNDLERQIFPFCQLPLREEKK